MKVFEAYKNAGEELKSYLYDMYSVRTYSPYTKNDAYSDRDEALKAFLNNANNEDFVELEGDGSDAIVYIWNTEMTTDDIVKKEKFYG